MAAVVQGVLRYNGHTFDGATNISVNAEMVYDESGQIVIAHKHTITVEAIVQDDTNTDAKMERLRRLLGQSGKNLIFTQKGFGTNLNVVGQDINGGPFPRVISWDPIAGRNAAEVVWVCETTFPVCVGGARVRGVTSVNYEISYDIDQHGMTVRTLTGHLTAANTPGNPDTADRYRDVFAPPLIPGYERTQSWTISPDRTRVDFTITDAQIASNNPYPTNVTGISGRHRVAFEAGKVKSSLSMSIQPEASRNGTYAWAIFRTVLAQKLADSIDAGRDPFLVALSAEDEIFGLEHSFSADWWHMGAIDNFIEDTGLWKPLGTTWNNWIRSISDVVDNRGISQLEDNPSDNVVPTLCGNASVVSPNNRHRRFTDRNQRSPVLVNKMPTADKSFLAGENRVTLETDRSVVRQQVLQSPLANPDSWKVFSENELGIVPSTYSTPNVSAGAVVQDVLQESGKPAYTATMVGTATRAGHEIPRPTVDKVGATSAHELNSEFQTGCLGTYFGVKVYVAQWVQTYLLPGLPRVLRSPGNFSDNKVRG